MEISVTGYIYSKDSESFSDCADRYAVNMKNHKFAISDGVTKSFFPNFWADVLVTEFVNSGKEKFDESKLILNAQKKWHRRVSDIVEKPDVKYFTKNAYNRGDTGLATFVGLQLIPEEKKWFSSTLGDSFLFFVEDKLANIDEKLVSLSSKPEPIIFDNYPDYYKSVGSEHKGNVKPYEGVVRNGTFYLMTDALAEWFLNEKENAIGKISVWSSQADFERFVDEERLSEKLANDDSAILIIKISDVENENKIIYKNEEISDIQDLILKELSENIKEMKKESSPIKKEYIVEEKASNENLKYAAVSQAEKIPDEKDTELIHEKKIEENTNVKTEDSQREEKNNEKTKENTETMKNEVTSTPEKENEKDSQSENEQGQKKINEGTVPVYVEDIPEATSEEINEVQEEGEPIKENVKSIKETESKDEEDKMNQIKKITDRF